MVPSPPGPNFQFRMDVSFVPHWNNAEGGIDLDTSRCFMGIERFDLWRKLLPPENIVVGLDEHSGIIMDCEKDMCDVHGVSSVTVIKNSGMEIYPNGASFSLRELGDCIMPSPLENGIRPVFVGRGFGNFDQDILMRLHFAERA